MQSNRPILIVTKTCPNCRYAVEILLEGNVKFERVLANDAMELVKKHNIKSVPALIVGEEAYIGICSIRKYVERM